eukprot:352554-Chlamydomonas_euryale.AAC.10
MCAPPCPDTLTDGSGGSSSGRGGSDGGVERFGGDSGAGGSSGESGVGGGGSTATMTAEPPADGRAPGGEAEAAADAVGDLEDLAAGGGGHAASAAAAAATAARMARVSRRPRADARGAIAADDKHGSGPGPGVGSVWVKTFGCSHNVSDGEYMAGLLQEYGYRWAHGCA